MARSSKSLHSGQLTLQRPDRFHAVRRGATGTVEMFLDGSRLTLFAEAAKAYCSFRPQHRCRN